MCFVSMAHELIASMCVSFLRVSWLYSSWAHECIRWWIEVFGLIWVSPWAFP